MVYWNLRNARLEMETVDKLMAQAVVQSLKSALSVLFSVLILRSSVTQCYSVTSITQY